MRVRAGSLVSVLLLLFALVLSMSLVVTYRPDVMSWLALGWESGLTTGYEISFADGSAKTGEYTRPMSAVYIQGYPKPVEKVVATPVLKINVPEKARGEEAVLSFRIRVLVDSQPVFDKAYARRYGLDKAMPLTTIIMTRDDLAKLGGGFRIVSIQVCDLEVRSRVFNMAYPGCKTLLTLTLNISGEGVVLVGGEETPYKP